MALPKLASLPTVLRKPGMMTALRSSQVLAVCGRGGDVGRRDPGHPGEIGRRGQEKVLARAREELLL